MVKTTNHFGFVIRKEALDTRSITQEQIDKAMEMEPLDADDNLISYGPCFGEEAADEFLRRLENLGFEYVEDFFIFSGDFPEWVSFSVDLT